MPLLHKWVRDSQVVVGKVSVRVQWRIEQSFFFVRYSVVRALMAAFGWLRAFEKDKRTSKKRCKRDNYESSVLPSPR